MSRETFTGKLIQTENKQNGPAGKPMTQALFHTVDDGTPVVAVWHDQEAPLGLHEGKTYGVEGSYVNHNGKHYFFKPFVELIEDLPPKAAKVRALLFRPRDWRGVHKVAAGVTALALVGLGGLVLVSGSGSSEQALPANEPVSSVQAAADTDTEAKTTENPRGEDCSNQVVPFTSTTVDNPNLNVGVNKTLTKGVNGSKEVCYPDGRQQPAEETVTTKPVNEVIEKGTKPVPGQNGVPMAANSDGSKELSNQLSAAIKREQDANAAKDKAVKAQTDAEDKFKKACAVVPAEQKEAAGCPLQ